MFSSSQRLPRKRKSRKKTAMNSATKESKTSVCTPHSRVSQKQDCQGHFKHCKTRRLNKLSRKSKCHVMRHAKRFSIGSLVRRSVRMCNLYTRSTAAFGIPPRSRTQGRTTSLKHPRKRIKIRRKRRKKPRFRKKRDMLTTWQYSPVPTGLTIHIHSTKRRRNGNHGVFHSRGSCCPTRKRRRVV